MRRPTAIILAGGRGTRVASLYPDVPKPMIPCLGVPFVEWVMRYLEGQGVRNFVVSLGHLAEVAETYFAAQERRVSRVVEREALGTGGGIALAWGAAPGEDVIAVNGDSLLVTDLSPAFGAMERDDIDGVIVATPVPDASRYGSLDVDARGLLRGFVEKRPGAGLINAGVYLLKAPLREDFQRAESIERDTFPRMISRGRRIWVYPGEGEFLDIGTPESVRRAESFLSKAFGARMQNQTLPGPPPGGRETNRMQSGMEARA